MAQLAARRSHNPKVASSILAGSIYILFFKSYFYFQKIKNGNSPTGIRTRVVWVKTTYPDQLDYWGNGMRRPGIKPGSRPWQGRILSLYYRRMFVSAVVDLIFVILFFWETKKTKTPKRGIEPRASA